MHALDTQLFFQGWGNREVGGYFRQARFFGKKMTGARIFSNAELRPNNE